MKGPEENYTIMVFRGARANPVRLKLSKTFVRRFSIVAICLVLVQAGILTHYFFQRNHLVELEGVQEELSSSRQRTSNFANEVEGMKQRMFTLEVLNRKLQTMFGLEPDEIVGSPSSLAGQGGEEIPYENLSETVVGEIEKMGLMRGQLSTHSSGSSYEQITDINQGLSWLDKQARVEKKILDSLAKTVSNRAKRWASTPSIWPVKGPITSRFGPRVSPFTGKKTLHAGVDIGVPTGTEVRAPAQGKVVVAAYDTRIGKFIRINHGFGIETTYGHLSKMVVKYGQRVQRGELIGHVGSTGKFSTGPHLHYQVAVKDRVVNPIQYILD